MPTEESIFDFKNTEYRSGVYPELLRRAPALDDTVVSICAPECSQSLNDFCETKKSFSDAWCLREGFVYNLLSPCFRSRITYD